MQGVIVDRRTELIRQEAMQRARDTYGQELHELPASLQARLIQRVSEFVDERLGEQARERL